MRGRETGESGDNKTSLDHQAGWVNLSVESSLHMCTYADAPVGVYVYI